MTGLPFLIAGGGIAGLAAALGLSQAGRAVRLFEQAAAFEEVGAGLQISPNGLRALQRLGAWEAVEPACVIPTEIHLRDGRSGTMLQRIRLGQTFEQRFGAPYRVCHRADLLAGLLETAAQRPAITLETGQRALSMASEGDGAILRFGGGSATGAAVVAADGIHSTLRDAISPGITPRASGHTIFRSLIAFADVPAAIAADCVTLWLYPGGHVVHYPVSNWRQFNIVAAIEDTTQPSGFNTPSDGGPLRLAFADCDDNLNELLATPQSWRQWQGADLPPLPRWSSGHLVLTGDAAHATLPYLAQGAVMALEDACVLSRALSENAGIAPAFRGFASERQSRTRRIQAESRKLGNIYHCGGALALARNLALQLSGEHMAQRRYGWIYNWQGT